MHETAHGVVVDVERQCMTCQLRKTKFGLWVTYWKDFLDQRGEALGSLFVEGDSVYAPICGECVGNAAWSMTEDQAMELLLERLMGLSYGENQPMTQAFETWVRWWTDKTGSVGDAMVILGVDKDNSIL